MRRSSLAILALIIVLIGAMLPPTFAESAQGGMGSSLLEQLITSADCIVVGTVAEHRSYWNEERTGIYTSVVLMVEENWKGTVGQDRITVTFHGGEVDEIVQRVSDMPSFEHGERAVVLLSRVAEAQTSEGKRAELQLVGDQFEVHGGFRGKFTVVAGRVGNLSLVQFAERMIDLLEGRASALCEVESSISVATSAYSYSGLSWPHPPAPVVSYRINENTADCTGEGAAVQAAAETWNAAGADFAFSYSGTTTATGYSLNGINEILWTNLGSGGPLARAVWWSYTHSGEIIEADIEFNDYYLWSTATSTPSGRYDVQTVALHELGHWLSLEHSADQEAIMYAYYMGTQRTLHADDIAGIRHIYGTAPVLPDAPSELTASAISSSRIDLTWQDNSDNESGFRIERRTATGSYAQIATVGAGVTSYSSTSLSAGTMYYYRVRAYSAAGNSAYSNEASATTLPPPPAAPTLKSPASGSTVPVPTPRLEWNASTGATGYGLQVATSSTFTNLLVNETGITDVFYDIPEGILNWNTTYYWKIVARDSHGIEKEGPIWSFTTVFEDNDVEPPDDELVDNPPIEEGMASIADDLVIVLLWQPATQSWDIYFPVTGDDTIGTLEFNRAYWIYVDAACTLEYGTRTIELYAGWNNPVWPAQ